MHDTLGPHGYPEHDQVQELVCGGVTQIGKTMFKVVLMHANKYCGMFTIIVTTTVRNARSLSGKINEALGFNPLVSEESALHAKYIGDYRQVEPLVQHLQRGGALVVNDTASAIRKAIRIIQAIRGVHPDEIVPGYCHHFSLILDEADAMKRTASDEKNLQIEDGLDKLRGYPDMVEAGHKLFTRILPPSLTVSISATLIPIILEMKIARQADRLREEVLAALQKNMFLCKTPKTYQGVKDLFVLRDAEGHTVFLDHEDLNHRNAYCFDDAGKVQMVFDDALKPAAPGASGPRRGVLLLFIANMRVTAQDNVHNAANQVREEYPSMATIVITGAGIELTFPSDTRIQGRTKMTHNELKNLLCHEKGGTPSVGDVIEHIDNHELLGLCVPVAVLGYSQMIRGDSFRSNLRVPTNLVLSLGLGQSIDRLLQAAGRATFKGRELLIENGFVGMDEASNQVGKTVILTQARDYDSAVAYNEFQEAICQMLRRGCNLLEILSSATTFNWQANFLGYNRRPVGNNKRNLELRDALESSFEETPHGAALGEAYLRRRMLVSMPRHLMMIAGKAEVTTPMQAKDFKTYLQSEEFKDNDFTPDQLRTNQLGTYLLRLWWHHFLERRRVQGAPGSKVLYEYWDPRHLALGPVPEERRRRVRQRGQEATSGGAESSRVRRASAARRQSLSYPLAAPHLREQVLGAWQEIKKHLKGISMPRGRVGRFAVCIRVDGEKLNIGTYPNIKEAANAYDECARTHEMPVNFKRRGSTDVSSNPHPLEWFEEKLNF